MYQRANLISEYLFSRTPISFAILFGSFSVYKRPSASSFPRQTEVEVNFIVFIGVD